jgi:hypothetical protein
MLRIREENVTYVILYTGQEVGMHRRKTPIKLNVTMSSLTRGSSKHPCVRGGTGQVRMTEC